MRHPIATIAVAGYLLGSLPVADTVARRHGIGDLRAVGDGNPGYWNVRETLGVGAALPVFVGDVAKGAAAAAFGRRVGQAWWSASAGGMAAMLGHAFPVWSLGRGGKSVLTFVGTSLVAAPRAAGVATALTGGVWAATGRFDRAARIGVAAFPVIQLITDGPRRTAVSGALMTFVGLRFLLAGSDEAADGPARPVTVGPTRRP